MNSKDIGYFLAAAGSRNLSAAAQQLRITQPTLTKSIARLERALGVNLFERGARGVTLTETGRVFVEHARDIHARLEDASAAMRDLRGGRAGIVRIGAGIGLPPSLMAAATRSMVRQGAMIEVLGGTPDSFAKMLLNGEIDFAIAGSTLGAAEELMWKPLFHDPLVAAAPANHPLARKRGVTWAELTAQSWIVPASGSGARGWFEHQFRSRGLPMPKAMLALRDYYLPMQLSAGLGALRLLAVSVLEQGEPGRSYRPLAMAEEDAFDRTVGLAWRAKGYLSPTAQRLMGHVEAEARLLSGREAPRSGAG